MKSNIDKVKIPFKEWESYLNDLESYEGDESKYYSFNYWFKRDNPELLESVNFGMTYYAKELYKQVVFNLDIPKEGYIVVLGAGKCLSFSLLCEKFGDDRCIGYDLYNPTDHPRVITKDCSKFTVEDDIPIAFCHNDLGNFARTPNLKINGYEWAIRNLVNGGYLISETNLCKKEAYPHITVGEVWDIETFIKNCGLKSVYLSNLPKAKFGDGVTNEITGKWYMVSQKKEIKLDKSVRKKIKFGFDWMGPIGPIPNGLHNRFVSQVVKEDGDSMKFFHEKWRDKYIGECLTCGTYHKEPRPSVMRTAFFDVPNIDTGYELEFYSCSELVKLPDTEANLRFGSDNSLNVNRGKRNKFAYVIEPYGNPMNCLGEIKNNPMHYNKPFYKHMSPGVIDKIREKEAILVFSYIHEGYVDAIDHKPGDGISELFKKLHNTLDEANIPPSQVFFLISNFKIESVYKSWCFGDIGVSYGNIEKCKLQEPVNFVGTCSELNIVSNTFSMYYNTIKSTKKTDKKRYDEVRNTILMPEEVQELKSVKRDKYFLTFNRNPRLHKIILCAYLAKNKLLDKGLISLGGTDWSGWDTPIEILVEDENDRNELIPYIDELKKKVPLQVEKDLNLSQSFNFSSLHPSVLNREPFKNVYFTIATESIFGDNDVMYLSEKMFKPIMYFQPFIYIGAHKSMQKFRDLGFKSFSPFINEDYDDIDNPMERMKYAVTEIVKLCKMNKDEIHEWYYSLYDIMLYNYEHLATIKNDMHKDIFDIIYNKLYEDEIV